MTGAQIIAVWDDHGFSDTSTTRKEEVLNSSVNEILADGPWTFQQEEASVTLSSRTPTMPTDFQLAYSFVIPSESIVLVPEEFDYVAKMFNDLTLTGIPAYYYFIGTECNIYPVPASSYSAKLMYLKNQTALTGSSVEADIVIPPKYHRVIVYKGLEMLYAMEDDPELSVVFGQFSERLLDKMRNDTANKQLDRPRRIYDVFANDDWVDS